MGRTSSIVRDRLVWLLSPAVVLAILLAAPSALAQHDHGHAADGDSDIGAVDFRVSCDESVRADFDRALGLLHHMMYERARADFEAVADADPDCAMAYWGVATTLFQPLWSTRPGAEDLERGRQLSERALELAPESERERSLIEATAAFFRGEDDFWDRMHRWIDGMAAAYEAAPDDADTAALYALSRLTLAQVAEDRAALHDEAERILRDVWSRQPTHPGAIHYTIHATDAEGRADNALAVVETYGEVAPEVAHALHMPSHIYVRLGDWPAVIEWNEKSAAAALGERVDGAVSHHHVHAIDYLVYAHLQRGEDEAARAAARQATDANRYQPTFVAAFHAAAVPARIAVERRDWQEAVALEPRTPEYLPWDQSPWAEAITWTARGLGAVHTSDPDLAAEAVGRLEELRDAARETGDERLATYIEIDRLIVSGWLAHARGDDAEAERLVREAARLEGTVEKHPVTPGALLPPGEALGDLLMEMDRPAEALQAYRASDDVWPGRFNTVLGAARAAVAADDAEAAREHYSRLLGIAPDSARPGVDEARSYLAGTAAR